MKRLTQSKLAAGRIASAINIKIIMALATRRAKSGIGQGGRPAIGPARPVVDLVEIIDPSQDGKSGRKTPLGYRTAITRIPSVLAKMPLTDPRRSAAVHYANAKEKIASVQGSSDPSQSGGGGIGVSDGGATARLRFGAIVGTVEGVANDWPRHKKTGHWIKGADLVILAPSNRRGDRLAITAMGLIDAVCLDGRDMKYILKAAGWSGQRRDVAKLNEAFEDLLDRVSQELPV